MMHTSRALVLVAALLHVAGGVALAQGAQPAAAQPEAQKPFGPRLKIAASTRADLARAYVSFERAFLAGGAADGTMDEAQAILLQRRFDAATLMFFGGQGDDAMRELHALSRRVADLGLPEEDADAPQPQATDRRVLRLLSDAVKPRFESPVVTIADVRGGPALRVQLRSLYVLGGEQEKANRNVSAEERWVFEASTSHTLTLGITPLDDDEPLWTQRTTIAHAPGEAVLERIEVRGLADALAVLCPDDDVARTLRVGWVDDETGLLIRESSRVTIGPELLSTAKARIEEALDRLPPLDAKPIEAADVANFRLQELVRSIARERARALSDAPSELNSAEFLEDLGELARSLTKDELPALEAANNPYDHKEGEWVMPLVVSEKARNGLAARMEQSVACRVYAPPQATARTPVPVVIALHGAGGDEAMWLHAYGAGKLRELADQHGFLIVSPSTYSLATKSELVESLLGQVRAFYTIDASRIGIIGHSLGAQAAGTIAWSRDGVFAGCVLFAGGRPPLRAARAGVPTLVLLGGQDPLTPADRTRASWEKAAARPGADVQVRVIDEAGHTLVVTTELERSIEWLLDKRLAK